MGNTYVLTAAGASNGIFTGTFSGGASGGYAGLVFKISGFVNPLNNGVWLCTDSSATTITTTNTGSASETHAGVAEDVTVCACLDSGGLPEKVISAATATGT